MNDYHWLFFVAFNDDFTKTTLPFKRFLNILSTIIKIFFDRAFWRNLRSEILILELQLQTSVTPSLLVRLRCAWQVFCLGLSEKFKNSDYVA